MAFGTGVLISEWSGGVVVAAEYDMVLVGWLGGEVGGNCLCVSIYLRQLNGDARYTKKMWDTVKYLSVVKYVKDLV